ncbi:hypothetical protein NW752_003093 [Fusarium irregulare]|uniref:Uncharacterized protein n=1 Tax=Fusarium irregulare TaxID=2494466 RepID=A0A9W8Q0R2_9HYPO|nr:hypothetical protein NW766_000761 [Fusarium irregulare]KAJ4025620.1 hypothetical protein NW752_003093 [Fusarium irregulare]
MANSDVPLEDSQIQQRDEIQTLQRMQRDQDELIRYQQQLEDHNRELQNTNNYLRGEVADLRAQLSYATQTLTARIHNQVDGTRATDVSEGRLRDDMDEQRRALERLERENEAAARRIQELRQGQSRDYSTPANGLRKTKGQRRREAREARQRRGVERLAVRTSLGPRHPDGGAAEQRQTQQQATQNVSDRLPVAPIIPDVTVKEEQDDSVMVLDDVKEEWVPGLPLLESRHLNDDVVLELTAVMEHPMAKEDVLAFLEHGTRNRTFCIHEIIAKGKDASTPLLSSQPCGTLGCKFTCRACAVETDSGVKMRITTFIPGV